MKIKIKCIDLDIYDQINDEFKNDTIAIYDTELNSVQFLGRKKIIKEVFGGYSNHSIYQYYEYGPLVSVNTNSVEIISSVLNAIKELEVLCLC